MDACDAGIMQEMAREGRCPHLARLLREGAVVDTIAPYGTFVGSSWMTVATGTPVGTHRYYNWLEVDPGTYALRDTTPRESRSAPFWQHLSDRGRRVAVLDVPHADLPAQMNGVLLKEWGCHDRHHGTASYPPSLLDELDALVGRHPYGCMIHPAGYDAFAPCDYTLRAETHRTGEEESRLLDLMRQGIAAKQTASTSVLDGEPWDLFLTVLGEGHCVGHQFWHVHDDTHPRHDPGAAARLGDPVREVYERLDGSLGAHLDRAGPGTTTYLLLNHGMGPHYDGDHLLDEVLVRLDRHRTGDHRLGWRTRLAHHVVSRLPGRARRVAGRAAAAAVRRRMAQAPPMASGPTGPGPGRRFFQIPGNTAVGAIRFNVVGREAQGLVPPGAELDALRDEVAAGLLSLVNVDTGRPAVVDVVRSEDVLDRAPDDGFPDLFVEWERSSPMTTVWSPLVGTVSAVYGHWRTGDHNDRGLFVARGPGIQAGRRSYPMSLVEVAPTVSAALGIDLPVEAEPRRDLVGGSDPAPERPTPRPRSLRRPSPTAVG